MRSTYGANCWYVRCSAIFSTPRCRYPIMHSEPITRSPASFSLTRNTPCVDGCCGPIFRMSSSAPSSVVRSFVASVLRVVIPSNSAFSPVTPIFRFSLRILALEGWSRFSFSFFPLTTYNLDLRTHTCFLLPALDPQVFFHPRGNLPDDVVVLPERIPFPLVGQQNAPQIRMPGEDNPEHVKRLALQPICGGPHSVHAGDFFPIACPRFHAQALIFRERIEIQHHVEPFFALRPIHRRQVGKQVELFFVAQIERNLRQPRAFYGEYRLFAVLDGFQEGQAELGANSSDQFILQRCLQHYSR